jgi:hypothetical protein
MNIEYLTPAMWETLRKFDYNQLMQFREMMQPLDEDELL